MFSTVSVAQTATVYDLTTVEDANAFLDLTSSTASDAEVAAQITAASQIIAAWCNRVFASQDVVETFYCGSWVRSPLVLKRVPVAAISSVEENDSAVDAADYAVDGDSGILLRIGACAHWNGPKIAVSYTSGYDLPSEAPANLARACLELIQEQRTAQSSSGAGELRMVSHDNLSVQYYQARSAVTVGTAALPPSVIDLITPYRVPSAA